MTSSGEPKRRTSAGGVARRWLSVRLLAVALVTAPKPGQAAVPTGGLERLQQLTRLPQLSFSLGLTFTGVEGFDLLGGIRDPARDIEELRKSLVGNPSDAPRYARLGRMLTEIQETQLAERAYAEAAELYGQQGASESREAGLLVGYAEVLSAQGQLDRAERLLRRAVEVAPGDSPARSALARFLAMAAMKALAGDAGVAGLLTKPGGSRPDAAGVEQAQRLIEEAAQVAARGVELGPQEPAAFEARATVGSTGRLLEVLVEQTSSSEFDPSRRTLEIDQAIFHRDAVPDLWTVARLSKDDPRAWGCAAMLDLLAEGFQRGLKQADDLLTQRFWPVMPESTRERVREAITRLEAIGQTAKPPKAAAALSLLGTLQFFLLRDETSGEASLRRATVVDPGLPGGWETLTFALVFSRQFEALVEVCQARLKHADSLRNRVLLAKAYEKTGQLPAMLAELEQAQAKNPDVLLANLALGAALLKAGQREADRARALPFIAKATQLAGQTPPREVALELLFQRGLYFALSGQRGVARGHFRQMLELDPQHAEATEALQALDQLGA